jgi:hypothetical protein
MYHLCEVLHPTSGLRWFAVTTDPAALLRSHRSALKNQRHQSRPLQMAYNALPELECSVLRSDPVSSNLTHLASSLGVSVKVRSNRPGRHSRDPKPWTYGGSVQFAEKFDVRTMLRSMSPECFYVASTEMDLVANSLRNPPKARPTDDGPFLLYHYRRLWDTQPHEAICRALSKTADAIEGGPRPKATWLVMNLYARDMDECPDITGVDDVIESVVGEVFDWQDDGQEFRSWAEKNRRAIWSAFCWT